MRRRRYRLPLLTVGGLLAPLPAVSLPARSAHAAEPTAVFHKDQDRGSGYGGGYTITNAGSAAINGWTLEFDLPANHTLGSLWNAAYTAAASHVTVKNPGWQPRVAPGASYDSGFNVAYSGPFAELRNCKLNGKPCDGSGGDDQAPTAPTNVTATQSGSGRAAVSWTASTDDVRVAGYDVYEGAAKVSTVTGDGTAVTIGGLADGRHAFTVVAFDTSANRSAASVPATLRTGKVNPQTGLTIGYFTQWSVYARGYSVKKLDTSGSAAKLDHLNYAFANVHPSTKQCFLTDKAAGNDSDPNAGDGAGDAWADFGRGWDAGTSVAGTTDTWDQKLAGDFNQLKQLKQLKAKYPNLKVQIPLGGWPYSKWFSDAAATDASRKALVSSCIDLYLKGDLPVIDGRGGAGSAAGIFDGIDLDWEWPNSEGHLGNVLRPADKANYTLLAQEFPRRLDARGATTGKHYTLSAFLPADPAKIIAGIDIPGLFGAFDFATVQGYDYHGAGRRPPTSSPRWRSPRATRPPRTGGSARSSPSTRTSTAAPRSPS
ncbi:chitinase [Kitasatospora cineracea]|uniref:chitinase n=1 Tax=Kitasatospora cineracea TaxID=88074 RepID=A0A8G1ULK9_9ACTN|nr:chitinase [Kitasatospora cineracea]